MPASERSAFASSIADEGERSSPLFLRKDVPFFVSNILEGTRPVAALTPPPTASAIAFLSSAMESARRIVASERALFEVLK